MRREFYNRGVIKRACCLLFLSLVLVACNAEPKQKPVDVPGQKVYALSGRIVTRSASDNTVRLDHEAVPGFMEAMTMDYSVRGAKVETLPPDGSRVTARLHTADDAYWVSDVKKVP